MESRRLPSYGRRFGPSAPGYRALPGSPPGRLRAPRSPRLSPRPGSARMDSALAAALNSEFRERRSSQKAELMELKGRFASYIEKVRLLEEQNKALLLEPSQERQREPSRADIHREELRELRRRGEHLATAKARLDLERTWLFGLRRQVQTAETLKLLTLVVVKEEQKV
ncbi:unnamed protein product [Coccothraustes coccothraustes]